MLINFCDSRLHPEIRCSTISTEGYEVTNLINNLPKGFLAYSCIKPPINIDITFLCNICINHILIWPYVGSQKSSGFQLHAKNSNDPNIPYVLLSTGYLSDKDVGVVFHPSTVKLEEISVPSNFLKRYIKPSLQYLTMYTNSIRISICKTDNSVPAIGKIEVWGRVSPRCGKDTVASVHSLWSKEDVLLNPVLKSESEDVPKETINKRQGIDLSLDVPESFLDAITCEIMTQPTLLPCGKIIDQTTLHKHEESQALWGRSASDPFTGIPFSEHHKPIVATALKLRIDKFLLDNCNNEEIKQLPRVLGRAVSTLTENQLMELSKNTVKEDTVKKFSKDVKLRTQQLPTGVHRNKNYCHILPAIVAYSKNAASIVRPVKKQKVEDSGVSKCSNDMGQSGNNVSGNVFLPNGKRFSANSEKTSTSHRNNCTCCDTGTFYELPCNHVVCRKKLTSLVNNQCYICGTSYKTSEVIRLHD